MASPLQKLDKFLNEQGKDPYAGMTEKERVLARMQDALRQANDGLTKRDFVEAFRNLVEATAKSLHDMNRKVDMRIGQIKNGSDGRTPTREEIVNLIKPLIPKPIKGEKGDPGTSYTVFGKPQQGIPGRDGSPDTPEQIRNKLESISHEEEKLSIDAIRDLRKELEELKSRKNVNTTTFAVQRGQIKLYDLSDQLDGSTKTFTLPAFWRVLQVQASSFPNAFRPTTDYTTNAATPSITFTSEIDAATTLAAGQTVTVLYAEP